MNIIDIDKFESTTVDNKSHEIQPEDSFLIRLENPLEVVEVTGRANKTHKVVACLLNCSYSPTRNIDTLEQKDVPPVVQVNGYLISDNKERIATYNLRIVPRDSNGEKTGLLFDFLPAPLNAQPYEGIWDVDVKDNGVGVIRSPNQENNEAMNQLRRVMAECREEKAIGFFAEYKEQWIRDNASKYEKGSNADLLATLKPTASNVKGSNQDQMTEAESELDKSLAEATVAD